MGEIAEDMYDGTMCSDCGMYFQDPYNEDNLYTHDYPVICWDCWDSYSLKKRQQAIKNGYQRALVKTVGD